LERTVGSHSYRGIPELVQRVNEGRHSNTGRTPSGPASGFARRAFFRSSGTFVLPRRGA